MGKRVLDVAVGAVLALVSLPLVLAMALLLAVELRAWPFFVQSRVGRDGRPFSIVKMRTLPPSTSPTADKYALRGVEVPPVARTLRLLHLDELPQLWLVVAGRMSLVGPRPEMPHLVAQLPSSFAQVRHRVRPGCTGLWQVSRAADRLIHEHPEYDRAYVAHQSLRLDLWILWQTVLVMLGRPQAVTLDMAPLAAPRGVGAEVGLVIDLDAARSSSLVAEPVRRGADTVTPGRRTWGRTEQATAEQRA